MRVLTTALLSLILLAGCSDDRVQKVARVRSLSQPELAEIYARLDDLNRNGAPATLSKPQIPPVVARLQPEAVMFRGDSAWIHLAGAFDDKAYLFVNGLGASQSPREIVLSAGEQEPRQVLWRQPQ